MTAYYNENDPDKAAWLRELIRAGAVACGDVDERSVIDVDAADLRGYTQCHFFAGIGVWSYALRLAGWPDERAVWTGSAPCQPWSSAGKNFGANDERHLAPVWLALVRNARPRVVFGEQVASSQVLGPVGRADRAPAAEPVWFDYLCDELEDADYAVGANDLAACGVGAPHIRQRLYFVARRLGNADEAGLEGLAEHGTYRGEPRWVGPEPNGPRNDASSSSSSSSSVRLANSEEGGRRQEREVGSRSFSRSSEEGRRPGPSSGRAYERLFDRVDWIDSIDGKRRPTEPGVAPLVDGASASLVRMRLEGYGDAIVAPLAAAFVSAYLHAETVVDESWLH